jgi:hypothetical protein
LLKTEALIEPEKALASLYVINEKGPMPFGLWQLVQLLKRIEDTFSLQFGWA